MKAGVTGYSGYLGKSLVKNFRGNQIEVITAGRKTDIYIFLYLSKDSFPNLDDMNCLIHLAGLAHRRHNKGPDFNKTIMNWLKSNEKRVLSLNICFGEFNFNQLELNIAKYHSRKLVVFHFGFGHKLVRILFYRFKLKIPVLLKIVLNQPFETLLNYKFVTVKSYTYQKFSNEFN